MKGLKIMEKREYIQLPALNRNISEEELLCIWEFAKLPGEVQEQMLDRVKGVLRKESIQKKIVPDGIYSVMTDRINRYMAASRKMLKRAMTEACQLAAFIYHECFVLEISVEEFKQEFPGYEDYIDVTVCYIQQLIDRSKEKN